MGSNYHGEVNFEREKRVGSKSRKGKKSSSDKPKLPQRGLGVAQLEKIRLHTQMGYSQNPSFKKQISSNYNNEDVGMQSLYSSMSSSSSFLYSTPSSNSSSHGIYPNIMVGQVEYDQRANIRYGDSQLTVAERWSPNNGTEESQHFMQPNKTLFNPHIKDSNCKNRRWKYTNDVVDLSRQNFELSDAKELDLELRLSL